MNDAYFDWLRLATWDTAQYTLILSKLYNLDTFQPHKLMQYRGKRSVDGRIFHGLGIQGSAPHERRHAIVQMSGFIAHEHRHLLRTFGSFYCTRLDVQVTIEQPEEHNAATLYGRVRGRKRRLIKSDEGSTVYIGSRRSDLFTRIYEKPIDGRQFLRCEFELKGDYSRSAWTNYQMGNTTVREIFATCHERAKIPAPWRDWFALGIDAYPNLLKSETERDLQGKLGWLADTEKALERMFYIHETHGATAAVIERLWTMLNAEIDNNI